MGPAPAELAIVRDGEGLVVVQQHGVDVFTPPVQWFAAVVQARLWCLTHGFGFGPAVTQL